MAYRLLFFVLFIYVFLIQARYVHTPLSQVPLYAGLAAWILIISERRIAIQREVKFLRDQIRKRSKQ